MFELSQKGSERTNVSSKFAPEVIRQSCSDQWTSFRLSPEYLQGADSIKKSKPGLKPTKVRKYLIRVLRCCRSLSSKNDYLFCCIQAMYFYPSTSIN